MKHYFNQPARWFCMVLALLFTFGLKAQEADNQFSLDAQLVTRGELRAGGFKADSLDKYRRTQFILGHGGLQALVVGGEAVAPVCRHLGTGWRQHQPLRRLGQHANEKRPVREDWPSGIGI